MKLGKRSRKQVNSVRGQVFARDGHQCVAAGTEWGVMCGGELTVQHRVARGMGSSARFDAPNCLLTMCAIHNFMDAGDASFRQVCLRNGWSVPRWVGEQEMLSRVPVWYGDGWYLLDSFYRYAVPDSAAEDLMVNIYG